jgi:hypothetical protein
MPAKKTAAKPENTWRRLPDGSRSVSSPWVWRGMLLMSLIALGLCISLLEERHRGYGIAWAVITVGWFSLSMWLWRRHVREDDQLWRERRESAKNGGAK